MMALNLAFTSESQSKRSLPGQPRNFKTLGIAKFGEDRLTTRSKSCIDIRSLLFNWWFGLFWAFSALKAISKMVVFDKTCCLLKPLLAAAVIVNKNTLKKTATSRRETSEKVSNTKRYFQIKVKWNYITEYIKVKSCFIIASAIPRFQC